MPSGASDLDAGKWRVLTEAIFPMAKSADAILLALDYCRQRGLDIFKRPVNIVPVWNSALGREIETVWPSINEVEITAARSGKWAGMDEPKLGPPVKQTFKGRRKDKDGSWKTVEETVTFPESATVSVYRLIDGQRYAFAEPVYWLECYGRSGGGEVPNMQWLKRPRGMLIKVAKAFSLRAAFPEECDLSAEEMEGTVIEGRAEPEASKWVAPPSAAPDINPPAPAAKQKAINRPANKEGGPPLADAPQAAPPAETFDAETGELAGLPERDPPHAIATVLDENGESDWRTWSIAFVAAIRAATTDDEIAEWHQQNEGALHEVEQAAPKLYARVKTVVASRRGELGGTNLDAG
jgi:phage recombination protein Bet